jgi:hypothetical protein
MKLVEHAGVTAIGRGASLDDMPSAWRSRLPRYCELLARANGIEIRRGLLRVFGIGNQSLVRDAIAWNAAPWRTPFDVPENVVFWGENIFGDQLGADLVSGHIVLLHCEGGTIEQQPFSDPVAYLESAIDREPRAWIESELIDAAAARGLRPSLKEHLSFVLPLMLGGSADVENLETMDAEAHLEFLAQIVEQSRDIPEGTRIREFRERR